jgi:hypothetical protein
MQSSWSPNRQAPRKSRFVLSQPQRSGGEGERPTSEKEQSHRCDIRGSCNPRMSSEMRGRQPFDAAASIKSILPDLSSVLDSPGERYLREERKIDLGPTEDLLASKHAIGWHPEVLFNDPGHSLHRRCIGCIVGIMTDPLTGEPTGSISRTYIDSNGRKVGKAKSLGQGGGIIRLSLDEDVQQGLFLAEGIETALAAASIGLRPIWSTGSNTRMAAFPLLPGVESLGILADHDAAGAGERGARDVDARWRAAGIEVRILMWEKLGDINDALRQGAAMGSSPEEILAHLRMDEISRRPPELSQASEDKHGFLTRSPRPSSSSFAQKVEEIADERRPVEVPVPRGERAKFSDMRHQNPRRTTPHQRPLIFADPSTLAAALCGRPVGPNQWLGLCPRH